MYIDSSLEIANCLFISFSNEVNNACFVTLPVCYGGLGIRKCTDLSIPAFISSTFSILKLLNMMLTLPESDKPLVT